MPIKTKCGEENVSPLRFKVFFNLTNKYFPWVIRFGSLTILVGLISMYLNGEEALSLKADKAEAEAELAEIQANQQ